MRAVVRQLEEIKRLEEAIQRSKSKHLKTDYSKRIARLKKELKEYCYYRGLNFRAIIATEHNEKPKKITEGYL